MAKRSEVTEKREHMQAALKRACISGELAPDEALASVRELAVKYAVSPQIAWRAVQNLVEEGVLYTIPRMGTFVARPGTREVELYLLVFPYLGRDQAHKGQIQMGFEERIAQLGGVSLMLTTAETHELINKGALPSVRGIFEVESPELIQSFDLAGVPTIYFGSLEECSCGDVIHFDDEDGGAQATRHLLKAGHRRIAFLGLHTHENVIGAWQWSSEREIGWRRAMNEVDAPTDLVFRASTIPDETKESQIEAAYETAMAMTLHSDIDAVVVVNSHAVQGLFKALRDMKVAPEQWPAVVGFDDDPMISGAVVSYLRLPWEHIGRSAADMLHDNPLGQQSENRQQRLIPMRLIPRLSCREQWTSTPELVGRFSTGNIVQRSG